MHIGFGWMCSSLDFLVSGQVLVPPKHWGLLLGLTPRGKKKKNNTKTTPWVLCQAYFSSCLLPSPSSGVKCLLSLLRA